MSSRAWGLVAVAAAVLSMSFAASAPAFCPEEGCPGDPGPGVITYALSVTVSGTGSVKSGTTTICTNVSSPCTVRYEQDQPVTLTAAPGSGLSLIAWGGECSGTTTCSFTMDGPKSVSATFADTTPPAAPTITSPIAGAPPPPGASQSISFSGSSDTASFRCRVDGTTLPLGSCTSPWSTGNLSTGTHTVYVWALDAAGNASGYTARSFKIVNRPDTSISGSPANGSVTNDPTTAFTYSSDTGTSYTCKLDGSLVTCNSNLAPADGFHTLSVAAGISPFGDGVWYYDTTPATRSWTVDTQAPDTAIADGPVAPTTARDAAFDFSGDDPDPGTALTFACSLDGGAASPCASGVAYHDLAAGLHTFSVVATDAAGNVDGTPATRSWTVLSDGDGDGFFTNVDCNDASAAIHPGAAEVPGNAVDENCDGIVQPAAAPGPAPGVTPPSLSPAPPRLAAHLSVRWRRVGQTTRVRRFTITRLPAGAKVRVACAGRGCPFRHRTFRSRHGKVDLRNALRRARLRKHATLTLTISAAGRTAQVVRYTARPPRSPLRR